MNGHRPPAEDYEDAGWTRRELHAQAWEAGRSIGWEDMDEYDYCNPAGELVLADDAAGGCERSER